MCCVLASIVTTVLVLVFILHVSPPPPPFKFFTHNLNIQLYLQEILNNAQRLKQVPCLVLNKPYKISDKIV